LSYVGIHIAFETYWVLGRSMLLFEHVLLPGSYCSVIYSTESGKCVQLVLR